jgi:hypothetical protein
VVVVCAGTFGSTDRNVTRARRNGLPVSAADTRPRTTDVPAFETIGGRCTLKESPLKT